MAIVIEDQEPGRTSERYKKATGEPLDEAVNRAALGRLRHLKGVVDMERARAILARVDVLPELDVRSADEIIG